MYKKNLPSLLILDVKLGFFAASSSDTEVGRTFPLPIPNPKSQPAPLMDQVIRFDIHPSRRSISLGRIVNKLLLFFFSWLFVSKLRAVIPYKKKKGKK